MFMSTNVKIVLCTQWLIMGRGEWGGKHPTPRREFSFYFIFSNFFIYTETTSDTYFVVVPVGYNSI